MSSFRINPGNDDFETQIEKGYLYIDKTEMIYEFLEESFMSPVLFTRPRRFGKTMVMTMFRDFLDIKQNSENLFKGLNIMNHPETVKKHMNQYPVIFLSLKEIKGRNADEFLDDVKCLLANLFEEFGELRSSDKISDSERDAYINVCNQTINYANTKLALKLLATLLWKHYGKKPYVIVDEYDVPMANAYQKEHYNDVVELVQALLGNVGKTNKNVEALMMSGCLHTVKNSGYTGFNNIMAYTVTSYRYSNCFGFTEDETRLLLSKAGLGNRMDEIREWYNGYVFGKTHMYNPWDVVSYLAKQRDNMDERILPGKYWIHSSESREDLIHGFIGKTPDALEMFARLMMGETVEKRINESLPYHMLHVSGDNLWTGLLETGYLTIAGKNGEIVSLRIPNKEIMEVFREEVWDYFSTKVESVHMDELMNALWHGNQEGSVEALNKILEATLSYYGSHKEYVYQYTLAGFFLGQRYRVRTEYESGYGRSDIVVEDAARKRALVLELKQVEKEGQLKAGLAEACNQAVANKYESSLAYDGFTDIHAYGISFWNKRCMIKVISKADCQ